MQYENGDEYEGGWQHGRRDGAGLFLYNNGDQFEGVWRNDVKHGPGKYLFQKSKKLLQGVWHKDVFKSGLLSNEWMNEWITMKRNFFEIIHPTLKRLFRFLLTKLNQKLLANSSLSQVERKIGLCSQD